MASAPATAAMAAVFMVMVCVSDGIRSLVQVVVGEVLFVDRDEAVRKRQTVEGQQQTRVYAGAKGAIRRV